MSIAQFALAERSIAETRIKPRQGKTPLKRLAIARSDAGTTPEAR